MLKLKWNLFNPKLTLNRPSDDMPEVLLDVLHRQVLKLFVRLLFEPLLPSINKTVLHHDDAFYIYRTRSEEESK